MTKRVYNVLFLCTGNSARSIIAERLLNSMGKGRFRGYSAGSQPSGTVNPLVLQQLDASHIPVESARSKSWEEFAAPDAPRMDLIITVCDQAAGETCPVWPGQPATAHWSAPDPAVHMSDPGKAKNVIREVLELLHRRISLLISLPIDKMDRLSLQREARHIADETSGATSSTGHQ